MASFWSVVFMLACGFSILKSAQDASYTSELFFDDSGAWLMFRKIIIGYDNKFGVSYDFDVRYEIENIGSLTAINITIEDVWDWDQFHPTSFQFETDSDFLIFKHSELKPNEKISFICNLLPLKVGRYFPPRANISYSAMNEFPEISSKLDIIHGQSSNYIISDLYLVQYQRTNYLSRQAFYTYTPSFSSSNQFQNRDGNGFLHLRYANTGLYHLQILSSSIYARSIGSKLLYWILFVIFCIAFVGYPLCMFDRCKGNISELSIFHFYGFGGKYVSPMVKTINYSLVPSVKKYIRDYRNRNQNNSKKE